MVLASVRRGCDVERRRGGDKTSVRRERNVRRTEHVLGLLGDRAGDGHHWGDDWRAAHRWTTRTAMEQTIETCAFVYA